MKSPVSWEIESNVLPFLKKIKKPSLVLIFLLAMFQAFLHSNYLSEKARGALNEALPGRCHVGTVSFDFWGNLHVSEFELKQDGELLLSTRNSKFSIALLPLIVGHVQISAIHIESANYRNVFDDKGHSRWEKLFEQGESTEKKESSSSFSVDAKVNIKYVNGIYELPPRKKNKLFVKRQFRLEQGRIVAGQLRIDGKGLHALVPIQSPAINVDMIFDKTSDEIVFQIMAHQVTWNPNLSRALMPSVAAPINFLNPVGLLRFDSTLTRNFNKNTMKWEMQAGPSRSDSFQLQVNLRGYGFPLTVEDGLLEMNEEGELVVENKGLRFFNKDSKGNTLIEGRYFFINNISSIYIDKFDVSKKDIINGLPSGIKKIIRTLKPNGIITAEIHYDHSDPELSKMTFRFEDLTLDGVSPGLKHLRGEVILDRSNFALSTFKGEARLSSLECLGIQFGPDIFLPISINGSDIQLGSKDKPFKARGAWASAEGNIHIKEKSMSASIEFQGIDLNRYQTHNKISEENFELNGYVSGILDIHKTNDQKHDEECGSLNIRLNTDAEKIKNGSCIDLKTSLPASAFFDVIFDWGEITNGSDNQVLTSGKINFTVYPNKLEIDSGDLLGEPFILGLAGKIRFGGSGQITFTPDFSTTFKYIKRFLFLGLLDKIATLEVKFDPDKIELNGEKVWEKEK
jgi:hypothetical protein